MTDWSDKALALGNPNSPNPVAPTGDWADIALSMKPGQAAQTPINAKQSSGLTLFMDPSKFSAVASGLSQTVPQGPDTGFPSYQQQFASAGASNPGYETAGKVLGTSLLGSLGGVEGATLPTIAKNMTRAAALADVSQGGASAGQALFPNNPIVPILGGLLSPLGAAGLLGGFKQGANRLMSSIAPKTFTSDELQNLGAKFNVPLDLADITQSKGLQNVRTVLEKTPFSGMLDAQDAKQAAIQNAGRNILETTQTPNEFGDPQGQVVASVNKAYQTAQAQKRTLYQVARNLAPKDDLVPADNMQQAAQKAIDTFSANTDLEGQPSWVAQFQKYAQAKPRNYSDLMKLSDQINSHISPGYPKTAEDLAWMSLDDGLNKDAESFAASPKYANTPFANAQAQADQFYKESIVPFKDRQLGNIGRGNVDSDTILSTWIKPNRPNLVGKLMDNMDEQGKNALLQTVIQKGFGVTNLAEDGSFSAMKFADYWDKLGTTKDELFRDNPDLKSQIDGYTKLVRAVGSPLGNPQTGHQIGNWEALGKLGAIGTAGYLTHGPIGAITAPLAAVGTGRAFTKMMISPWGQRLLLTAAQTNDSGLLKRLAVSAGMNLRNVASNPGSVSASAPRIQPYVQMPPISAPR